VSTFDYQEGTDYAGLAARLELTAAEVQGRLLAAGVPMGLGDVNGDGLTNQIGGNVIRIDGPQVHLLPGSNQDAVQVRRCTCSRSSPCSRTTLGQLVRTTGPEERHPPRVPPRATPTATARSTTRPATPPREATCARTTQDALAAPGRNSGTNPTRPPSASVTCTMPWATSRALTDGRGVVTEYVVNSHSQVVETRRAVSVNDYGFDPVAEPLWPVTFGYVERTFYDHNGNVILRQVDRGNTSNTDGNLPAADLPAVAANPDPVGARACVDTAFRYDMLDRQVETIQEVTQGVPVQALRTRFRYDRNGNRVMTIEPEGNADAALYDERDLLFQSIAGASARPAAGLFAAADPTTFNRPGGAGTPPGVFTYNYDRNGNLIESVDAQANGGATSLIAGVGDVSATAYDGFDRPRTATDALGNQTVRTYDPASNVVRVVTRGAPVNDVPGSAGNVTLAVTEHVFDELSRNVVSHAVLFQTPGHDPSRTPVLTDTWAMDAWPPTCPTRLRRRAVPGVTDITVLGRVSSLAEYDRAGRATLHRAGRPGHRPHLLRRHGGHRTVDGALDNGFDPFLGVSTPRCCRGTSVRRPTTRRATSSRAPRPK
jgi:YD repeat-containing protein